MQYLAASQLISELKTNYTNKDFKYTITKIKSTIKGMTEIEKFPAKFMLGNNQQFIKCITILINAVMDARNFAKNKKSKKVSISVH